MLQLSKVLGFPTRLPDVPGNNGELAVLECLDALESSVKTRRRLTLFQGATGCGKSKVLPAKYAQMLQKLEDFHGKKLLVLTCAAKDVESMNRECKIASHYRTGGKKQGGCRWDDAHVIFSTVGMFLRWYANCGMGALNEFGAVLLDEIGAVERQIDYSFIFRIMREKQTHSGTFKILMCTATMSERLSGTMGELRPHMIECSKRPHVLERCQVDIDTLQEMYIKLAACAKELLNSKHTCLIFLPGEGEITKVTNMLNDLGVATEKIFPLFADLDHQKIKAALEPSRDARLVLATSIAELALTIPDVDVVLDTGIGRWTSCDEVPTSFDYLISPTAMKQREGRAGRLIASEWTR